MKAKKSFSVAGLLVVFGTILVIGVVSVSWDNSAQARLIAPLPTCEDSDGGKFPYTKGTLQVYTPEYGNMVVEEYCTNKNGENLTSGDYVEELVCLSGDPDYAYVHKRMKCQSGCNDGACIKVEKWKVESLSSIDQAYNFINGKSPYKKSVAVQSISWADGKFIVLYRTDLGGSKSWGWKLATDLTDLDNFISGTGAYSNMKIKEVKIVVKPVDATTNYYYIFYR